MVTIVAVTVGALAWAGIFLPPRAGFWHRALAASAVLGIGAAVTLAAIGDLGDTVTGAGAAEVAAGGLLAVVGYLVVRLGYPVAQRWMPALAAAADDLFALRTGADPRLVVAAPLLLGTAEELLFRGIVQQRSGLLLAVVVYTAVQLVTRNWLVLVLGVVGGSLWGLLLLATGSLVPGLICHVVPIAAAARFPPGDVAERYPLRSRSGAGP